MSVETDAIDESIIAILRQDGRISFREIGRQLDTSESTVRQRVRRLQKAGAIRIGVVVDLTRSGRTIVGWVRLTVTLGQRLSAIEKLVAMPETTYVATTSGQYNVFVVLSAANLTALLRVIDDDVSSISGVHQVDVRIAGRTIKHNFHEVCLNTR